MSKERPIFGLALFYCNTDCFFSLVVLKEEEEKENNFKHSRGSSFYIRDEPLDA